MDGNFFLNAPPTPPTKQMLDFLPEKNFQTKKEQKKQQKRKKIGPPLSFFSLHGKGDTIRIGQEIQCVQYAGFFLPNILLLVIVMSNL